MTGLGELNFEILQAHGVKVIPVDEAAIRSACLFHLHHMKLLVEPSAGVCVAALRSIADRLEGKRVGIILSGGNTDLAWLSEPGSSPTS